MPFGPTDAYATMCYHHGGAGNRLEIKFSQSRFHELYVRPTTLLFGPQ